ncbi:MAG: hypothetical protein A2X12_10155 [Bacteroidetes bacterium GWE2_29_8]|nr:MAG: hypothetical protein A2X12_10155 [Bacteroidetes bacterium GWE2_29_8]OFY20356.1 MAG: hypothetical protein A2X02_08875 [Bacteroidetes bacterium GWF2_29_10]
MKLKDIYFILIILVSISLFFIFSDVIAAYNYVNINHGIIMSFIKFGILATLGEIIALRIKEGVYFKEGFGIMPKMLVWGLLGIFIKFSFVVFAKGTPLFLEYIGVSEASIFATMGISVKSIFVSFSISVALNCIFAPIMMTIHKITDLHIHDNNGSLLSFIRPINVGSLLKRIDWDIMWGFVFRKTIPIFWIPAHTITFLLAPNYQILFAALLSIALGIILSFANLKK